MGIQIVMGVLVALFLFTVGFLVKIKKEYNQTAHVGTLEPQKTIRKTTVEMYAIVSMNNHQ